MKNIQKKPNAGPKGVGYEKRILANELLNDSDKKFIIPIVRNNHSKKKLPTFLSGALYVDFDNEDFYTAYKELIERVIILILVKSHHWVRALLLEIVSQTR
mgnify:CR=1 FL=1